MTHLDTLRNLVLAPYILKAMALIRVQRLVGGNQFRHCFMVLGILLDYKLFNDSVLLKAALLHDLFEDIPGVSIDEIRSIDNDGRKVVDLVLEVTRQQGEKKEDYLRRLLDSGSRNAMTLKCADRISNITDLHSDTHSDQNISDYLDQTEKYVIPMAGKVNENMVIELTDLIAKRRKIVMMMGRNKEGE